MPNLTPSQRRLLDDLAAAPDGLIATLAQSRPAKTLARHKMIEIRATEGGGRTLHLLPPGEAARHEKADQVVLAPALAAEPTAGGKLGVVLAMIRRPQGATSAELMQATGWQAHSVRGALAGAIKKKLKVPVVSRSQDGVRTYTVGA